MHPKSRYSQCVRLVHTDSSGRQVSYLERRFLPDPSTLPVMERVRHAPGQRLDTLAHTEIGDAGLGWRICDANGAMNSRELLRRPTRVLHIPVPQF